MCETKAKGLAQCMTNTLSSRKCQLLLLLLLLFPMPYTGMSYFYPEMAFLRNKGGNPSRLTKICSLKVVMTETVSAHACCFSQYPILLVVPLLVQKIIAHAMQRCFKYKIMKYGFTGGAAATQPQNQLDKGLGIGECSRPVCSNQEQNGRWLPQSPREMLELKVRRAGNFQRRILAVMEQKICLQQHHGEKEVTGMLQKVEFGESQQITKRKKQIFLKCEKNIVIDI